MLIIIAVNCNALKNRLHRMKGNGVEWFEYLNDFRNLQMEILGMKQKRLT